MPDDDRERLVKLYRELGGGELLRLYRQPDDLPAGGAAALRSELRLRGIDPDSLEATVPKATSQGDDEGDPPRGEMDPPEGFEVPPEVRRAMESASSSHAENLTAARELAARRANEGGTLASATLGLLGVAALVFAVYVFASHPSVAIVGGIAAGAGFTTLVVSAILYRRSSVAVR